MSNTTPDPVDFGSGLSLILAAAPGFQDKPGMALAAAQAGVSPNDAAYADAYSRANDLLTFMQQIAPEDQQQVFEHLSAADQSLLASTGFTPAAPPSHHRGFLGTLAYWGSAGTRLLGHTWRFVSTLLGGSTPVMEDPKTGQRYAIDTRTGKWIPISGDKFYAFSTVDAQGNIVPVKTSNPIKLWQVTSNGERYFDTLRLMDAQSKYSPDVFNLALRLATGESIEQIADYDPQKIGDLSQIAQDPSFLQAFADINAAKTDPGRMVAANLGLHPNPKAMTGGFKQKITDPYSVVSGSIDAAFDFFLDPMIVGGKVVKAAELARWGIKAFDQTRIEQIMARPAMVRGYNNFIIPRINTIAQSGSDSAAGGKAFEEIVTAYPTLHTAVDDLVQLAKEKGGNLTYGDVVRYVSDGHGFARIMTGQAPRTIQMIPGRLSAFGEKTLPVLLKTRKAINTLLTPTRWLPYDKVGATPEELASKPIDNKLIGILNSVVAKNPTQVELHMSGFVTRKAPDGTNVIFPYGKAYLVTRAPDGRRFTQTLSPEEAQKAHDYLSDLFQNQRMTWQGDRAFVYDTLEPEDVVKRVLTQEERRREEEARDAAKQFGQAAFDWRKSLRGRLAMTIRRLLVRVPDATELDITSPYALKAVYQLALLYLPRVRASQVAAAFAAADEVGKRTILYSLWDELGHASGLTLTKSGNEYWGTFMNDLRSSLTDRQYSVLERGSGVYERPTAAGQRPVAGLLTQMTPTMRLPSFKEMHANAARIGILDRLVGYLNNTWVDSILGLWRTGVLLRPGFAMRVSLDDLFSQFFAGLLGDVVRTRLVTTALNQKNKIDKFLKTHPLAGSIGKAADDAVNELKNAAAKTGDGPVAEAAKEGNSSGLALFRNYILAKMSATLGKAAAAISDPDTIKYITELLQSKASDRLTRGVLEDHGLRRGAGDDVKDVIRVNMKLKRVRITRTGAWTTAPLGDDWHSAARWSYRLEEANRDPLARFVMRNIDTPFEELQPQMVEILKSPVYDKVRDSAVIAKWTKDGRSVAAGEATPDEALADWARDTYDNVRAMMSDGDGNIIRELADYIAEHKDVPATSFLRKLPGRPRMMSGPEYVWTTENPVATMLQRGWEVLVSGPMNWLSRQPILFKEYVNARKMLKPWEDALLASGMSKSNVKELVSEQAETIAQRRAITYIHNPALRSQFSVLARNLFPFRHAEESALQRWARRVIFNPEGLRKSQLVMEGLRHSGLTYKDSAGNDVLVFPGTWLLNDLAVKLASLWPSSGILMLPIRMSFESQVRFLSPFLTEFSGVGSGTSMAEQVIGALHPLIPPGGPIMATSLQFVHDMFPESRVARDLRDTFISEQGREKPDWEAFVPTSVARFYKVFSDNSDSDGQLASAMRNAAAYLEAAGLTPSPNALPSEQQVYLDRLRSWARTILVMRAIFGFWAPAAPSLQQLSPEADPLFQAAGIRTLRDEFLQLTKMMPYQDAVTEFVRLHPDETPFVDEQGVQHEGKHPSAILVAQSESPSGAVLNATNQTLDWMDANKDLLTKYPYIVPFLMPLTPGPFNYEAYKEQLALKIRQSKTIDQFYDDLKIRVASDTYFPLRDAVNQKIAELKAQGRDAEAERYQRGWALYAERFKEQNPIFAEYLAGGAEREQKKLEAIGQLRDFVHSPEAERVLGSAGVMTLRQVVDAWDAWQQARQQVYGRTDKNATMFRQSAQQATIQTIKQLTSSNPQFVPLWTTIFAPLLEPET